MNFNKKISIIGGGNIGTALLKGFLKSEKLSGNQFIITRRNPERIVGFNDTGIVISSDNKSSVKNSDIIILAVLPQQLDQVLPEIAEECNKMKIIVSVVSAVSIEYIKAKTGNRSPVIRAMPNTAAAVGESMTCLSSDKEEVKLQILS
jgi:pyrroline-5-carboxylate reductase